MQTVKLMEDAIAYRLLKAPFEDGGVLVEPDPGVLVASRQRALPIPDVEAGSQDAITALASEGRAEILAAALRYTRSYRDVAFPTSFDSPLFVAGHQPELYHPGVWAKSFALSHLARRFGGVALNLVVDSDIVKGTTIAVPTGDVREPRLARIAFDAPSEGVPHEMRRVQDRDIFRQFGAEVCRTIGPLVPDPLVCEFWPLAWKRLQEVANLGLCLAQARHILEARWNLQTLELPQSRVCATRAFALFALHMFLRAEEFRQIHNAALAAYRRRNRLRSRSHPVPELERRHGWIESPFWIYSPGTPRRRRLFVRRVDGRLALSDLEGFDRDISASEAHQGGVEDLLEIGRTVAIRSRALATTMFARLCLADYFVHGIGGAKYDELTDEIIRAFFGVVPPRYLVVSASVRLPIPRPTVTADDLRRVNAQLRELSYHPEVHLNCPPFGDSTACGGWSEHKWNWIRISPTPDLSRQRWLEIRRANNAMQPALADLRQKLLAKRDALKAQWRSKRLLGSREFAFCLYPLRPIQGLHDALARRILPTETPARGAPSREQT